MSRIIGKPRYGLELIELNRAESVDFGDYEVEPFEVSHRIVANGYALREDDRPGRFDPEAARALGVEPGPDYGELQEGRAVAGRDGTVEPDQVMGPDRPGRTIVITGDTEPCEETEIAAEGAELLVHDASFTAAEDDRAAETGHSTALGAAELAAAAGVGDARPRPHLLAPLRARHPRRGARRLRRDRRAARLRPRRGPAARAGPPGAGRERRPGGGADRRRPSRRPGRTRDVPRPLAVSLARRLPRRSLARRRSGGSGRRRRPRTGA